MNKKLLIYLVDDENLTLSSLERILRNDWIIKSFSDPQAALMELQSEEPDLILSDYSMPAMSGLEFLHKVQSVRPSTVRVLLSGHLNSEEISEALKHKLIHRFFVKPWENDILKLQLVECLTQRHLLQDRDALATLALTDPITNLGNHRFFQDQIKTEVSRAQRHNRHLSLIMIDIDHFKMWDDRFGHPEGDILLKELAQVLLKGIRSIDCVARYGGDEFAIILPDTPTSSANEIAERLRKSFLKCLERMPVNSKGLVEVSISLGVGSYPEHADSAETLIQCADQALLKAKNSGRNQSQTASRR